MRTLKEEIGINAGTKNGRELNEDCKVKEMEAMARAYSTFSNFARDIENLKTIYERPAYPVYGPVPSTREQQISSEEKEHLRKKLYGFCMNKLEYIKEIVEETLGDKSEDEEDEDEENNGNVSISFVKEE